MLLEFHIFLNSKFIFPEIIIIFLFCFVCQVGEDLILPDQVDSTQAAPGAGVYQPQEFRIPVGPIFNFVTGMCSMMEKLVMSFAQLKWKYLLNSKILLTDFFLEVHSATHFIFILKNASLKNNFKAVTRT